MYSAQSCNAGILLCTVYNIYYYTNVRDTRILMSIFVLACYR